IVVANGQTNSVSLLPGVGRGFFDDRHASTLSVGSAPRDVFVGNFDGRPGLDLATVNRDSNTVTLLSGFAGSSPSTENVPSGGESPVAALVGDFNRDGLLDLVVANNGDGRVALLTGGAEGLSLSQTLTGGSSWPPSDLALSLFDGRALTV